MPQLAEGLGLDLPNPFARHIVHLADFFQRDRKSTRLNSSHANISYAVFCLKKKKTRPNSSQGKILLAVFDFQKKGVELCNVFYTVIRSGMRCYCVSSAACYSGVLPRGLRVR